MLSQKNFEKIGYLRQHFVRFEDSLLENNSGTFKLNSNDHIFRNITLKT